MNVVRTYQEAMSMFLGESDDDLANAYRGALLRNMLWAAAAHGIAWAVTHRDRDGGEFPQDDEEGIVFQQQIAATDVCPTVEDIEAAAEIVSQARGEVMIQEMLGE